MTCKLALALLCGLLFTSGALAISFSRLGAHVAHRRQSRFINSVRSSADAAANTLYSDNWSGAFWSQPSGTFTKATGTFTVPTPSGSDGTSASIWVGVDGNTCDGVQGGLLQTGIDFTMNDGNAIYDPWYEWYPALTFGFTGSMDISAGDVLTATVIINTTYSGVAMIENKTTGQTVRQQLHSTYPLCGQNAEWIVEDADFENSTIVPFADFSKVTFTAAIATGPNDTTYTPRGATIVNIKHNETVLTNVTVDGDDLTIVYV